MYLPDKLSFVSTCKTSLAAEPAATGEVPKEAFKLARAELGILQPRNVLRAGAGSPAGGGSSWRSSIAPQKKIIERKGA